MCLIDNAFMTDERALDEQARRELTMLRVDATNEYRDARGAITEKRYAAGTMSSGGFVGEVEAAATRIFHSFAKTSMNRLIELADIGLVAPRLPPEPSGLRAPSSRSSRRWRTRFGANWPT